jgi:hypothetical protein
MNTAEKYVSYADWAAYQISQGLKATISSYSYSQEVEQCKRADKRLAKMTTKKPMRDPHHAALKLAHAILEVQGESK